MQARRNTLPFLAFYLVLYAVAIIPLFVAHTLPLRDFQAHLARMAIIAAGPHDPFFSQYFTISYAPTGAFVMEVLLPPAVKLLGMMLAGKIFVALTFLLLTGSVTLLNVTLFGRLSWWPALSFLLLYNLDLTWGFMNYLFGLGVLLLVLAAWLRTGRWGWSSRILCFSLLSYFLLICHLYTFALYGACVASVEISVRWQQYGDIRIWLQRRAYLSALQFVAPVLVFFLTSPTAAHTVRLRGGLWSPLVKLYGLVSIANTGLFMTDLAVSTLCYIAFITALACKWIVPDRRLAWVFIGLIGTYPLWPDIIFGGGYAAYRLPVAVCFLAIAATAPAALAQQARIICPQAAILAGAMVLQIGLITAHWHRYDRVYAGLDQLIDQVPPGKRLLFSVALPDRYYGVNTPPVGFYPQLALVRRHIFVNGAFVWPQDNSSISLTAPFDWLQTDAGWGNEFYTPELQLIRPAPLSSPHSPFRPKVLALFDYALLGNMASFGLQTPPPGFERIAADGDYVLYRVGKS
jgi:hypothetical protein